MTEREYVRRADNTGLSKTALAVGLPLLVDSEHGKLALWSLSVSWTMEEGLSYDPVYKLLHPMVHPADRATEVKA